MTSFYWSEGLSQGGFKLGSFFRALGFRGASGAGVGLQFAVAVQGLSI